MSLIDTYQLATMGQNSRDTYTRASLGILIDVQITPLPPAPPRRPGGSPAPYKREEEEKERDRKKITVIVTIDNKKYTESVVVEGKPDLSVQDVDVDVQPTDTKPKITISVKQ
jgi:hypothetical protein